MYVDLLIAQQLHARSPMLSAAPILPENGSGANHQWMQQHADLPWLRCGSALPLTLLPQRARATARLGASLGTISPSSPTACCTVQKARRCVPPSNAGKRMAVCASSTALGSAIAATAQSVRSVNGMERPRQSRVGSVFSCIPSGSVPRRCTGRIGVAESTDVPVCSSCETSGLR